ncbi:MAG: hydroxyethylthiazole kinase [Candidatus Omnitrophica bacterium]|jgi:hydroxyethylthiazole kinase|nr:hydroxyethylthiazole kinase [Candidatus Omnitrophota bacterium]
MIKTKIDVCSLLKKIRKEKPIVHHLTNWVTIYDCANIVKAVGASPVMAHAKEEVAEMANIASSLVLNIGTLTPEFVEAMKIAARSANKKGIPVILDVCGAGATRLRDEKSFELLNEVKIDIIKGNASEIVRLSGENIRTKGVDSAEVEQDILAVSGWLANRFKAVIVATGKHDIVRGKDKSYIIKNGHPMMTHVVGTGCMAASVIGAFAAVSKDLIYAASSALVCFEVAAELAAKKSKGPASFKEELFDRIFNLDERTINKMQKIYL